MRSRAVALGVLHGETGSDVPCVYHPQHPLRRPDGIDQVVQSVLQPVGLGLVPLGDLDGDAAERGQSMGEVVPEVRRAGFKLRREQTPDMWGVLTPRYHVVEENVAVGDEYGPPGEIEKMTVGEIRVVIASEKGRIGHFPRKKRTNRLPCFAGVRRSGARPGVERITVEYGMGHALEQGAQLGQAADPAGVFTEVQIGNDAGELRRHGPATGAKRAGRCNVKGAVTNALSCSDRRRFPSAPLFLVSPVMLASVCRVFSRLVLAGGMATVGLRADSRVTDLIEIHREAIGGGERIAALTTLRASGRVLVGGTRLHFHLTAARPNRIRLETAAGGRIRIQGFDGTGQAWETDSASTERKPRPLAVGSAKTFVADAEFDDPLIAGAERGYRFDFAGEQEKDGRKCFRLLVTRQLTETFTLLVDAATYFVVSRVELRLSPGGRKVPLVTDWSDFRPVAGVLLAHRIIVTMDGRALQETQITEIEANPVLASDHFGQPAAPFAVSPGN